MKVGIALLMFALFQTGGICPALAAMAGTFLILRSLEQGR